MTITPYVPPAALSALPSAIWSGVNSLPVLPFLGGQSPTVPKTPQWSTKVAKASSGKERRTDLWASPLWKFELSYEVVHRMPTNDELGIIWEFFNVARGQFNPWLFVDPSDNSVIPGSQFGVGDGVTTVFQLGRWTNSFYEPIYAAYAPVILDNGAASGTYSVGANGLVTFATPPTAGHSLTWSGYFYFLCRFDQDDLTFEQMFTTLWEGKSMKFTSIRP